MLTFKGRLVKPKEVIETFDGAFSGIVTENIDTDNRIVKNVCVMGTNKSKNNRTYTENAMTKLASFTEGTKCFVNHPGRSELKERDGVRDLKDWVGVFRGARRDGNKIYSNLHVRESYFDLVKDIALLQPANVGNSINARVKVFAADDGTESVADVDMLRSIDLVANAATTQSLFESAIEENYDLLDDIKELHIAVSEGLLTQQLDNQNLQREISDLIWSAGELARGVIRSTETDVNDKRNKIKGIYKDLSNEIDKRISSLKTTTKTSPAKEGENTDGGNVMDLKTLKNEHPDLFAAIEKNAVDQFKKDQDVENINKRLEDIQASLDEVNSAKEELEKERKELQKTIDELNSKNKELEVELDKVKTAEKAAEKKTKIQEMLQEAKLPKGAISEVFMEMLMALEEDEVDGKVVTFEEQAKLIIDDRKSVWSTRKSKTGVKNSGDEFVDGTESKKEVTEEDVEKFVKGVKNRR